MSMILYLNGKKVRFWVNFGWYSGELFYLLQVQIMEIYEKSSITLFSIQVIKLSFGIGFDLMEA